MFDDFANEIEEIIHLAGGGDATLAQVRQDLTVIAERMRAAQHRVQADTPTAPQSWKPCQKCGSMGYCTHSDPAYR